MTYHSDVRKSKRHAAVIDWLRQIFDPKRFPCFDESFIHPNDLMQSMAETAAINFGGNFIAAHPYSPTRSSRRSSLPEDA